MLILVFKETILTVLAAIRLLKVVAALPLINWAVLPLKVTVAVPAVNAVVDTLLTQLPFTAMLKLLAFSVPAVMVRLLFTVIAAGNKRLLLLFRVRL